MGTVISGHFGAPERRTSAEGRPNGCPRTTRTQRLVRSPRLPFTTIVMPALNEESFILDAIRSILPDVAEVDCELIVVDGGSTDRTRELVRELMREDPRIRLVANERRIQAAAVNLGAKVADPRAEVILRADCHALYPPGFVAHCVSTLITRDAASVVVPMHARGSSWLQQAIAHAQNCRLGNGGAAHRSAGRSGYVDHGHHAAFRRKVFEDLGGYDVGFICNEDAELDRRMTNTNHKIFLAGDATITYFPRDGLHSLARQYFKYGVGRAQTLAKHRTWPRIRQLLPVILLLGCTVAICLSFLDARALLIPLTYVALCVGAGLLIAVRERAWSAAASGVAAIVMHMSWASGFLVGLKDAVLGVRPNPLPAVGNA